jgi:exopolysaccharide biosynthesis polyprenyl glycosylphosphotransferase
MLRQFSVKRIVLTAAVDWLGSLATLVVAGWLRTWLVLAPGSPAGRLTFNLLQPQVFWLVAVIWPFFLVLVGAYDGSRNATLKAELLNVFLAINIATLTLAGALFFTFRHTSRLLFLTFYGLDVTLVLGLRVGLWAYRLRFKAQPHPSRRQLLVIGAGRAGRAAVAQLQKRAWSDVDLVAYLDDDPAKKGQVYDGAPVVGGVDHLPALLAEHQVQDAIVALPLRAYERLVDVCHVLQRHGVRVHVIPDLFALSFPGAVLERFGGIPVIDLGQPGIYGWRRFWKRAFDMALAALGVALLSPLMGLIAAAIRLESRGPVLYRQQRIGENGHPFTMLKFRSMWAGADSSLHQAHVTQLIEQNLSQGQLDSGVANSLKLAGDPRVTRVGRVIRQTSLDELPQLINVLRGEMSLVGPRPPIAYEVELYQDWHRRRLEAPPGITGLWQVHGRNRVSFDEMVRMDLEYIEHQSLWLDLQLLAQTPLAVLAGRGAG